MKHILKLDLYINKFIFMKNKKIKIFAGTLILVAVVVATSLTNNSVQAARYVVKDGNVVQVGESLDSNRHITNSNDIQILFDEKGIRLLIGKGIKNEVPESEVRGGTELYIVNNDGADNQKLTDDLVSESFLNNDGSKAYYVTTEKNLFEIDIVTKEKRLLQEKVFEARLSNDNTKIAYHKLNSNWQQGDYYENALGIAVLDLKTKKESQVTSGWDDFFPIWTPDDKKIIFYGANPAGLVSQFVVDVNGNGRKQISNLGQIYYSDQTTDHATGKPDWSPDGKTLVYESDNKIWINEFNLGYDSVKADKVAYGKAPKWLNNREILLIVTESKNANNGVVKIDKSGNVIK